MSGGLIPYARAGWVRHSSGEWTAWVRIVWFRTSVRWEVSR